MFLTERCSATKWIFFKVILTDGYIRSAHLKKGKNGSEDDCTSDLPMNHSFPINKTNKILGDDNINILRITRPVSWWQESDKWLKVSSTMSIEAGFSFLHPCFCDDYSGQVGLSWKEGIRLTCLNSALLSSNILVLDPCHKWSSSPIKSCVSGEIGILCTESLSGVPTLVTAQLLLSLVVTTKANQITDYTTITWMLHIYVGWTDELWSDQCLWQSTFLDLGRTARKLHFLLCKVWGSILVTSLM